MFKCLTKFQNYQFKYNELFKKISSYSSKNINCSDINDDLHEQRVSLYGWLHNSRINGKIILLRDHSGIIQLIPTSGELSLNIPNLESVIKVNGVVKRRSLHQINKNMMTGRFEVHIDSLEVINEASKSIPIFTKDVHKSTEIVRMKYRYLDLRKEEAQNVFRFRSKLEFSFSEFLIKHNNFVNIGTPSLFKSTPGGAREYIVPTKDAGYCYSLIQSPQQHKQLLMIGGFDRYMQLARCYRDEMSRPNRQPEFTQLDIEMSFVERHHIQMIVQDMLVYSLQEMCPELKAPFPVLSFSEALQKYGSDKPDMRFGLLLEDFVCKGHEYVGIRLSRELFTSIDTKEFENILEKSLKTTPIEILNTEENNVWKKYSQSKEIIRDDFILCTKRTDDNALYSMMGDVRLSLGRTLHSKGKLDHSSKFSFLWVDRFPLFEINAGTLRSVHHQFTSPIKEHIDLIYSDPIKVIGEQFDLVCNGVEVGGGSIRIHNADLQEYIITHVIKEDVSAFDHLLVALRSGAPPHGGFALGNDRLVAVLTGSSSIRDVIAFPKTADGRDPMSGSPDLLSEAQCAYYHLHFDDTKSRRDVS